MSIATTSNQYNDSDWAIALSQVRIFSQWLTPPVLTEDEIEMAVLLAKRVGRWVAGKSVLTGEYYIPSKANGRVYCATQAGVTGSTEPTWPTVNNGYVEDGTTAWRECGAGPLNIYDMQDAIRKAWEIKAAKASALISTQSPEQRNEAQQVYDHCMRMVNSYACIGVG